MKDILEKYSQVKDLRKGEILFFRGEEVKGLYVLLRGSVVAEMVKDNGEAQQIEEIKGEQMLATAFVFGDRPYYPVDLRAKTDCKLCYIPKEKVLEVFQRDKRVLEFFLEDISSKAQFLSNKLWDQFQHKSLGSKIKHYLLQREVDGICKFDRPLKDLADFFAVTRPSLSRILGQYVEQGNLERLGRNQYRILDREALEEE